MIFINNIQILIILLLIKNNINILIRRNKNINNIITNKNCLLCYLKLILFYIKKGHYKRLMIFSIQGPLQLARK